MVKYTEKTNISIPEIISFIKQKDYEFIKRLGKGSFGITILIKDNTINEHFICKKYYPQPGIEKEKYYKNFLNEIKLMYKLNHNNIVRIFSYSCMKNQVQAMFLWNISMELILMSSLKDIPK